MALTSISGAIWVVPTIPRAWLHQGLITPFADYTSPALALGILCGGAALATFVMVLLRPRLGALVSLVAGVFMVGFELVEILVVGFTPVLGPNATARMAPAVLHGRRCHYRAARRAVMESGNWIVSVDDAVLGRQHGVAVVYRAFTRPRQTAGR